MTKPACRIVVCANQAWNLVNFRSGLIAELQRQGCEVIAIAPPDPEMEARLAEMGCRFVPVGIDAMGLSPLRDLGTLLQLRRIIRREKPDAWLSWTIKPNVYGVLAARSCGVKAYPNVSGLGTAFIRTNLVTRVVKLLYRTAFKGASRVFFQNADDAALFTDARLVDPARVTFLPGSGIDPKHWRSPDGNRPKPRQFLMVARVVGDKGVREYVAAARAVRMRWPDTVCRLMGPIDVANRTAIGREEFAGWLAEGLIEHVEPSGDVRPQMIAADFVVLPSYREGLSRVLLEASAMGRPIVTTDVPGCRDVVRDGESGFLCKPADAESLTAAMARACETSDADWHRMAAEGRRRAIEEFSIERVNRIYLDTLRETGALPVANG
ncbi:glycosyltransferase family 4 protein [Novosphingobium sp. TH158]|uniref:glycosyltransferase family 4 protein n=1 Tax=Novosphingobium sp. TH158 TaxID=2067455 RepID=UPI00269D6708